MTVLDYYKVADKNYFIDFCGPDEKKYYGSTLGSPGIVEYLQNCEIKKITRSFTGRTNIIICEPVADFTHDNPIYKKAVSKIKEQLVRKGEAEVLALLPTSEIVHFAHRAVSYCDLYKKTRKYILGKYSKEVFEQILKECETFFPEIALIVADAKINVGWPDYEE